MKFLSATTLDKRKNSDLLVIPYWTHKKKVFPACAIKDLEEEIQEPIATGDFKAEHGTLSLVYHKGRLEKRIALLGLGDPEEITVEKFRRACGNVVKLCHDRKLKTISFVMPEVEGIAPEDIAKGVAEGFLLANYSYSKSKQHVLKEHPIVLLEEITLIGITPSAMKTVEECILIAEGVYLTRDLVNGNADDITPQFLAKVARDLVKKSKSIKVTVFDKKTIEKHKMGLILAVSRNGPHDPVFIIVEYRGNPKSKDNTIIVGKGVTFDTGGLNLKPTGGMETMKSDMSGAAAALGCLYALANLKLKVNVTVVIPATENSIGPRSYKPGDVYTSYSGKTVEIGNTDAEGRLILADALAYAVEKLKPTRIIDLATLTGAMIIALGDEASGVMSTNDALADGLVRAGVNTFERIWRMPLYPEYREQLKSEVADIKNTGGRSGGSITAALFLKEFVDDVPWAHVDIAGTAYLEKPKRYQPQHGTGFGVRLLVDFLQQMSHR